MQQRIADISLSEKIEKPIKFLTEEFLEKYRNKRPKNAGKLFEVVYLRTYSRWLPDQERRERWDETVERVVNASLELYQGSSPYEDLCKEAESLYESIFDLRILPAGRSLWIAGTEASKKFGSSVFNCSYLNIDSIEAFAEAFHLLLNGCGVGFGLRKEHLDLLPNFNIHTLLNLSPYAPVERSERIEDTVTKRDWKTLYIFIGDSREGWVEALRQYLQEMSSDNPAQEISINFNSIRPEGERIKSFGGRAPGPNGMVEMFQNLHTIIRSSGGRLSSIAAMDIMNFIAKNVIVGGTRRSSQIALGEPEDQDFIDAKKDMWTKKQNLQRAMSNNSLIFSDKPSKEYLREVFQNILNNGEPGFWNFEAARSRSPYAQGTNPCLTSESWIATENGPKQVHELIDKQFKAIVNGKLYSSSSEGFFPTGEKKVYKLKTKAGFELELTADHKVLTTKGWKEAGELKKTDLIVINNVGDCIAWSGPGSYDEGWLLGSFIGDGCFSITQSKTKNDLGIVRYWGESQKEMAELALSKIHATVSHRADLGIVLHKTNKTSQVGCVGLGNLAKSYQINSEDKKMTSELERTCSEFYRGFLRGIFDADGSVQGSKEKGYSIRLSQTKRPNLVKVQRMLLRLGIVSTIYPRREEGYKELPDGKGGTKEYFCQKFYELIISRQALHLYSGKIGFSDPDKAAKLSLIVSSYKRAPYKNRFETPFESLEYIGIFPVYDCTIEQIHRFDANGLVVHNCGEILLDSKQFCNLCSLVLTSYLDEHGELNIAQMLDAMRMLVRIGLRQTNVTVELPEWDKVQKRDRLLGISMTGIMDALDAIGITFEDFIPTLKLLRETARKEADRYADEMGVPRPLLVTCVKPEGTLSQLPTVSSGIHRSYAPYYIRRIRVSAIDPVAKALQLLGVPNEPDKGKGERLVFSFPIKTSAKFSAAAESAVDQFNTYIHSMRHFTDHNTSITIQIDPSEMEDLIDNVLENWSDVVGCAFLPKYTGAFPQMPYEEITKEQYDEMVLLFPDLSDLPFLVNKFEIGELTEDDLEQDPTCAGGHCPIR